MPTVEVDGVVMDMAVVWVVWVSGCQGATVQLWFMEGRSTCPLRYGVLDVLWSFAAHRGGAKYCYVLRTIRGTSVLRSTASVRSVAACLGLGMPRPAWSPHFTVAE